jgi:hypothetical protein
MRATAKSLLFATLAVNVLYYNQPATTAAVQSQPSGMTAVINTVTIKGPAQGRIRLDHHGSPMAVVGIRPPKQWEALSNDLTVLAI